MRNRFFLLLDLVLLAPLPFFVLALRYESFVWPADLSHAVVAYAVLALPIRIGIAYWVGLYRAIWKHASLAELETLVIAGALASVLTIFVGAVFIRVSELAPVRMPYSTLVWDALLAVNLLMAPRIAVRLLNRAPTRAGRQGRRAIIAGAGEVGQQILRTVRTHGSNLHFDVVGFVDDDPSKQRQTLGGLEVYGTIKDLPRLIRDLSIDEVIIAIPSARGSLVRRIMASATEAGAKLQIVPGMTDLMTGRVKIEPLRDVQIEDLLRREPIRTELQRVRDLAHGKVVLVSGAGGSIGSELCRQIADLEPSLLVVLDHSENQVFEIQGELRRRFPKLRIASVIADVRDARRLRGVFDEYTPHAVFHAAAHKHVPLMEENIVEAVTNNIMGTRNMVDAAIDANTKHFIFISTDKAVRPTSIMGATKRVAEQIVRLAAESENKNFVSVRFGNVLGSRGSVIPTFLRQIREGGPVTVTHPEMRRYFMTIPEAVQLVLQAAALGNGGELFALDMGEPVKIIDLARDLIRLSGLEEGVDIDIQYSGIRPGEKLYEEVFFGHEDVRPTEHPKVLRTLADPSDPVLLDRINYLVGSVLSEPGHGDRLRELLHALVPDFEHEDARTNPKTRHSAEAEVPAAARPKVV